MDKETLERAKELERNISTCESILKYADGFKYCYYTGVYVKQEVDFDIPNELTTDIKALIEKKLEEYKQEFEIL